MARKDPQVTAPTVESKPQRTPDEAAAGPVDPVAATISWDGTEEGYAAAVASGGAGGEARIAGKLLRRVAQFVLLERLGAGGMGVVFAAFDEKLERKVAIKLVAAQGGDGRARERLLREAQSQAKLSHPNVVTVYEVGALPEGELFIAMELVKGETLREWQGREARSWQEVLAMYSAAGEGLAVAHRNGIVHRDFKPDNILLGEDGRVRVADFGLAFAAEPSEPAARAALATSSSATAPSSAESPASPAAAAAPSGAPAADAAGSSSASPASSLPSEAISSARASAEPSPVAVGPSAIGSSPGRGVRSPPLTAAGTVAGTPGYMAPEQLTGGPVDARTDQFAFCVALYEALYDDRPYADFAFAHEDKPAMRRSEPDPEHPRWLWDAIVRGLSSDPARRFPSMDELLAELARNRDRSKRRTAIAAGSVGAFAVIGVAVAAVMVREAPPPPCPIADEEMAGIWDTPTQQKVQTALLGTSTAFAGSVWSSTKTAFDGYSNRWLKAHQAACEATHVRHVQSDELLDRRMECLAGRKRSLAAAVEVLQLRPAQAVTRAAEVLASLGDIELCSNTGVLLQIGTGVNPGGVDDPGRQAKLEAASGQLARARVFAIAGDLASADADVAKVRGEVESLKDERLLAELRLTEATSKLGHGEIAESIKLLDHATESAVASHHDELLIDIWLVLARDVGTRDLKLAQIESWLGQAEAWIRRLNLDHDPRRVAAAAVRGSLVLARGDAKQAVTLLTQAIDAGESLWGKRDPRLVVPLRERAAAFARLRQPKDAFTDAERALALGIAAYGADHPTVARTRLAMGLLYVEQLGDVKRGEEELTIARSLFSSQLGDDAIEVANCDQALGVAAQYRGDYATFLEYSRHAEQIYLRRLGAEHPRRGEALLGVGVALYMTKDFAGSLEAYQRAYPIMRAALGEEHITVAVLHSNLGEALLTLGRAIDARNEFARALQIFEAKLGADHADLALPLKGLGLAHLSGNRPAEALTPLERALALRTRSAAASDPQEVAEIRWALARTLRLLGRTPARARDLATESLATYRTLGPEMKARSDEIAQWLKR